MTTTLERPNRYPAACIRCGTQVGAGKGLLAKTTDGRWAADHPGDCPNPPAPNPVQRVDRDGIYRADNGTLYKVQIAKRGSGRLYAKELVLTTCADRSCGHPTIIQPDGTHSHGHFLMAPGMIHTLRADQRLPEAEARTFGRLYGVCVRCGSDLTDETSIAEGLGPICAARY